MKRIISFLLLIVVLISCVACDNSNDTPKETDTDTSAADTGVVEDENTFKVGFARIDMTPAQELLGKIPASDSKSNVFKSVRDPLYATCIAVSDGEETALILTLDTKHAVDHFVFNIRSRIRAATGIMPGNVIVSVTHNHSSPDPGNYGNVYIKQWLNSFFDKVAGLAKEAIADMSDAEVYVGKADTTGYAFVRRYLHADGTYSSIQNVTKSPTPIVGHETEADADFQMIRFAREGKKDVVLANWQAHVAHAIGAHPSAITSDFVYFLRTMAERQNDIYFAYFQGASGNINFTIKVKELAKTTGDYSDIGLALARKVKDTLPNMTKVETGKIKATTDYVNAVVNKDSDEKVAQAQEIVDSGYKEELIKKYGFATGYDVRACLARSRLADKEKIMLSAISFGDIAFVAAPYEMFDTNGMEVKEGSPFEMTFVLSCANGHWGYIASEFAFPHLGYEVAVCKFVRGTAEQLSGKLVDMLEKQKAQTK